MFAKRPLVGVFADVASSYGRAVMRGIYSYANIQRRWHIFDDPRLAQPTAKWPEFDAIIVAGSPSGILERAVRLCPIVAYCSGAGDPNICHVISLDDYASGRLAAEHLADCGLKHFGVYAVNPIRANHANRIRGFVDGLAARKFACDAPSEIWPTINDFHQQDHRQGMLRWIETRPRPFGVFAVEDYLARDLAETLAGEKIAVPEAVSILGHNNDDLLCEVTWPPLSSIDADFRRIGHAAAITVDRLLTGQTIPVQQRHQKFPPVGIVQRQSTSLLAIDDPSLAEALRFIREHACSPCTVKDILRAVPVGRRWLERQFLAHIGRTPHQEIARIRMDTAKRLLAETDLKVEEIVSRCGFSDRKCFYDMFTRMTDTTPAAYRREISPRHQPSNPAQGLRRNAPDGRILR